MAIERSKRSGLPQLSRNQIKSIFTNIEYLEDREDTSQAAASAALARLPPVEQTFARRWFEIIARTDVEVARVFALYVGEASAAMDQDGVEAWLLQALEAFDQRGLGWAVDILQHPHRFARIRNEAMRGVLLADLEVLLGRLILGFGGRELRLIGAEQTYTDTETIFLPAQAESPLLYKAVAAHHWAQTCYGTWRPAALTALAQLPSAARQRFFALERLRLDACIARDLPGLYRQMQSLSPAPTLDAGWTQACTAVSQPNATAVDSCTWALQLSTPGPAAAVYHGDFYPERVQGVLAARLRRERRQLRSALERMLPPQEQPPEPSGAGADIPRARKAAEGFSLAAQAQDAGSSERTLQLRFDERPIPLSSEVRDLLGSIIQDLGEVPEEYFKPGAAKPYDASYAGGDSVEGRATAKIQEENTVRYREWDYTRQRFRPGFCILREHSVISGDPEFVIRTRRKYHGLLKSILRTFEAMLGEERRERRQVHGDDIDLDALVETRADARHGEEPKDAVYTRLHKSGRSIAVMFMVDMSGSTKGWVNEAEREALVLLCEALETIGDRYAIYGFSGRTHKRVDIYHIKRFIERYDERVRARISGITPQSYTRMGAPIRHLGGLLQSEAARNKLLITLSDGKPEDYGSYYGKYGIEDTRHALLELRRTGIHPFCITIDREGRDYLPHMYGPANYVCIDEVRKLPLKVADIYRKLTT